MAKDVNWNRIKVEYVTGSLSYKALAAKHKVQPNALSRRAKAEGWPEQRREFRAEAAARAVGMEVDNEAKRLSKLIKAADCMSDVILKLNNDAQQFQRHIVIDGETTVEKLFDKVDTKAIKDLTGALKDMTFVQRNLNNLPTQAEREAQRIAAERLNLDKQKANMDRDADKSIKVELETAEEYAQ